jgi:REP element-mobilizing transposase RayT
MWSPGTGVPGAGRFYVRWGGGGGDTKWDTPIPRPTSTSYSAPSQKTNRKLSSAQGSGLTWRESASYWGRNVGIVALAIGGIEDHVHSLVELPPTMSLSKALNLLKSNSSGWMSEKRRRFRWQEGYGAFAVSVSNLATVKRYVLNQQAQPLQDDVRG